MVSSRLKLFGETLLQDPRARNGAQRRTWSPEPTKSCLWKDHAVQMIQAVWMELNSWGQTPTSTQNSIQQALNKDLLSLYRMKRFLESYQNVSAIALKGTLHWFSGNLRLRCWGGSRLCAEEHQDHSHQAGREGVKIFHCCFFSLNTLPPHVCALFSCRRIPPTLSYLGNGCCSPLLQFSLFIWVNSIQFFSYRKVYWVWRLL